MKWINICWRIKIYISRITEKCRSFKNYLRFSFPVKPSFSYKAICKRKPPYIYIYTRIYTQTILCISLNTHPRQQIAWLIRFYYLSYVFYRDNSSFQGTKWSNLELDEVDRSWSKVANKLKLYNENESRQELVVWWVDLSI